MKKPLLYFKVLREGRKSPGFHAGNKFVWPPIGSWTPRIKSPMACQKGYHLTDFSNLYRWLKEYDERKGLGVYLAQVSMNFHKADGKIVAGSAKLVKRLVLLPSVKKLLLEEISKTAYPLSYDLGHLISNSSMYDFFKYISESIGYWNNSSIQKEFGHKLAKILLGDLYDKVAI